MHVLAHHEYEFIFIDFEFRPIDGVEGNPLEVICMVALNLSTGVYIKLWENELNTLTAHPFGDSEKIVLVAFYASAEMSCFSALKWNWPKNILDLFAEFRNITNGHVVPTGYSLLGAMKYFGLEAIEVEHKKSMRDLALRGGPYSEAEKVDLLDYCQSDVDALKKLFLAMNNLIDLPRALLRGLYAIPLARMEDHGAPIDIGIFQDLCKHWDLIKSELVIRIDKNYGVYENGSFKEAKFRKYLIDQNIPWDCHSTGRLRLDADTFEEMSKIYPILMPLRHLRDSLGKLRLNALQVGLDGRNRCMLSPYQSSTGRNQPSTNKFVFGLAKWARGLIQPHPGNAIAYIDWSQQEFGVAAALSGDQNMLLAYQSDDPYLAFAKQAKAVPENATKKSHPQEREQYKACVLATQYGMGAEALALRLRQPLLRAKQLLKAHRRVYEKFWAWSDDLYNKSITGNNATTVFGWQLHVKPDVNPRSLKNFPMQANSAEMLRIACIMISKAGIQLCAPVHDAILIEAPDHLIEEHARITQLCMAEASKIVLNGFELGSDVEITKHPNRFLNNSSRDFWDQIMEILIEVKADSDSELPSTVLSN